MEQRKKNEEIRSTNITDLMQMVVQMLVLMNDEPMYGCLLTQ